MNVAVVGLGNWGTALANQLAHNGHQVLGWDRDEEVREGISRSHYNPKYLKDIELHENVRAADRVEDIGESAMVVLVLPSKFLSVALPEIPLEPQMKVVSGVKGLAGDSLLTPLQCVSNFFPKVDRLAVISGPGFAKDIVVRRPAGVVAASQDEKLAREVAHIFASESLRVYLSDDPLGVEIGGVVKNVIAIAAGVADGMGLGDSARAGLITRGLAEMMRLAVAMGASAQTLSGLSGLGDLVLTATCDSSRNRTVGLRLGRGESLEHIIETLGSVAEGVSTTPLVLRLAAQYGVEMPISFHVNALLRGEITPQAMLQSLVTRPLKREF